MTTEIMTTVRSTGYSSARYGVCEVCCKHVSDVFVRRLGAVCGWDVAFGHEACLSGDAVTVQAAARATFQLRHGKRAS